VGAFGEDAKRPSFAEEGKGGPYGSPPPALAVDWEGTDKVEELPEREDEELLFGHPLQAPWYGDADQHGIGVLAVIRGDDQWPFSRNSVATMQCKPE